jgi:uncharacterized membrane protein YdcZ (DUF606 family)
LVTAAAVDQWGLFGVPRSSLDALKLGGLALIACGIVLVQLAGEK